MKPRIYTVATTHLDTSWSWDFETTLADFLPKTPRDNFERLEKYPEYVFSFEGSYRYELLEEYYPELFAKVKEYIAAGRWHVAGSSFENGDVNIPSPEALFRNILYGNEYFDRKFGKRSRDIYLPDCFGFGFSLPSIAAHANLLGFTTQKLVWSCAYGIPFDLGVWEGVDGKRIYACFDGRDYNYNLKKARDYGPVKRKLRSNMRKYDLPFTLLLHGIGDRGGAPRERSVSTVCKDIRTNDESGVDVLAASTDQVFRDMDTLLTKEQKSKLPVWKNELVMTDHGVGCYTSRTLGKRFNRRCEQLADAAERTAVTANLLGFPYPQKRLETAWKNTIAHQFHDDITGTSLEVCYKRNWNDYVLAMNIFSEEYRASAAAVAASMDASFAQGTAVLVSNPVQGTRRETVTAEIDMPGRFARVFDSDGKEVLSQILSAENGKLAVAFSAEVPPNGFRIYDVRPSGAPCAAQSAQSGLSVTQRTLENECCAVTLDDNGDISSVFDKRNGREALSAPVRMALFDFDGTSSYPAWELTYSELRKKPRAYAGEPVFVVVENGPARVAVKTTRKSGESSFTQIISLSAGGERVDVYNEVDWRSLRSLLKAEFPLAVQNPEAAYDIGLGTIKRGNSHKRLYEVPAQMWADITARDGDFGVSVFSDSRVAWDKPNDNTLRLTGVYSPQDSYRSNTQVQDFGLNRFSFALFPHEGRPERQTQLQAAYFNQPMGTFTVPNTGGGLPSTISLLTVSDGGVIIRAVKKAENSDKIVVRVNEGEGRAREGVKLFFMSGIQSAEEIYASEEPIGAAKVQDGALVFDIAPFEVKSFMLTVESAGISRTAEESRAANSEPLQLPYNINVISANGEQPESTLPDGSTIPAELFPDKIVCGGTEFVLNANAAACERQTLTLPEGCERVYIAASSFAGDKDAVFMTDKSSQVIRVSSATEAVGAWDLYSLSEAGYIKRGTLAWHSTHTHRGGKDELGRLLYMFKYELDVSGCRELTLPDDPDIVIFAATAMFDEPRAQIAAPLYDVLEKGGRELKNELTANGSAAVETAKWRKFRCRMKFLWGFASRRVARELSQLTR
ncbi:MAG: hypothetical protein FWF05_03965 [Oscillospiraceae bacterium]|nr:hypothetical protein [Oscillospiraceae bacterium]